MYRLFLPLLACLSFLLLSPPPLFAEQTLKEVVDEYMAMFTQSVDGKRKPVAYPELAGRVEGLFRRFPITHIAVSGFSEGGGKRDTDIYIEGEEIYVVQADEGWNLVANNMGIFEWEKGKKDGIVIKRSNSDLFNYLYYLTDPSWIMAGFYGEYLASPDKFTVIPDKTKKWTELRLNTPRYGFEAIYVTEKPLWFCGMRINKGGEKGQAAVFTVSEPKEIKALPKALREQLKGVRFEKSSLTLKRHLSFL